MNYFMLLLHKISILIIVLNYGLCELAKSSDLNIMNNKTNSNSSYEQRNLILNTDNDFRKVKGLSQYFEIRQGCLFDMNQYAVNNTEQKKSYCPTTADYLLCFPSTHVNRTVYSRCPYKNGISIRNTNAMASKYCNENGVWEATNYLDCIKNLVSHLYSTDCYARNKSIIHNDSTVTYVEAIECESVVNEDILLQLVADLYLLGFIITLLVVSAAIGIFCSFRSLRCLRNMIHSNLLFTFFIKSITFIPFWFFVIRNYEDIILKTSHPLCVVFQIMWNYSLLASFFWMMIEGIYLITVIIAAYSSSQIKLWWYLIIGWGLPMIPMIPYTILTIKTSNTTCNWIKPEYNSLNELFIDVPIYIVLMINFMLLITILYFIITKLKQNNDALRTRYNQYKKLIRATIVLFPLLGLTFALFIYQPSDPRTLSSKIYFYINIFFQTTQGIWASVVYCFFNDEVHTVFKTKFRNWKSSRDIETSLYTIISKSKPKSRAQSLARSNSYTRTRSQQHNNDTALIPMLQKPVANDNDLNQNETV